MLTLSGFNKVRFLETTFPEQLKIRSDAELLAQMQIYFCASFDIMGSTIS